MALAPRAATYALGVPMFAVKCGEHLFRDRDGTILKFVTVDAARDWVASAWLTCNVEVVRL